MTQRIACPPAPGPLEAYAEHFDALFDTLAQRRSFREYLQGLLLPRERNKTLTALAGVEPIVGAQAPAVQRLQFFLSESAWDAEAVNAQRLAVLCADPATSPYPSRATPGFSQVRSPCAQRVGVMRTRVGSRGGRERRRGRLG